jgi:hypothetical protein
VVRLVTGPVVSLPVPRLVAVVVGPAAMVLAAVIPGVVKKVLSPLLLMAAAAVMAVMAGVVLLAVPVPPTAMLLIVWVLLVALMTVLEVVWDVVVDKTQKKVVAPVLRRLADDERIRQRSLAVGAVLFMIAFLCQFTAALLDISGP